MPINEEFAQAEDVRRRIAEFATRVHKTGVVYAIRTPRGPARYQLAPISAVDPEVAATCVQVGPDEFRRRFPDIRALVRVDDLPFGIVVQSRLCAIFRRHPKYRPIAVEGYRARFRENRGESPSGNDEAQAFIEWLREIEIRVGALEESKPMIRRRRVANRAHEEI